MVNVYVKKYVFYLIGIILFSLLINLGTAWDDVMARMLKPLFRQVLIATIILLHCYLYFIQKLSFRLLNTCPWFAQLADHRKFRSFVFLNAFPVLFIHLLILNFLLLQRNHGSLFRSDYFHTDFWFFFIPLICYTTFLYFKPQEFLFRASKKKEVNLPEQEDQLQSASSQIETSKNQQKDRYLELWKETKVKKFLLDHYSENYKNQQWLLNEDIPLWKLVLFEKTATVMFGYFANGEKWALLNFDDTILNNPWVIKINQSTYVNMLYVLEKTDYRVILKINEQVSERPKKEIRVEVVTLYEQVQRRLEAVIDCEKMDFLLQISRRMKYKNYNNFWEDTYLQQLDESRLEDRVGSIED